MVKPSGRRRTPAPSQDELPRLDTLPEVARRLRRIGDECSAAHFAVFLVVHGDKRLLLPSIDSEYPGNAPRTAELAEALNERFLRRAGESTRPFWWTTDAGSPAAASLARCIWAEQVAPPPLAGTAVALPLTADRDDDGLIVLSGESMAFTMNSLTELHARCLSLFGLIARLKPNVAPPPPMSRREIECLKLTANGRTSEEIAATLGLSVHTATQHLTKSTQKLNAVNRIHAVAKALRLRLID